METMTEKTKAEQVREYARQTMGTLDHHQHPLDKSIRHTDGVQFVAETCGAFWLIDLIASHQGTIRRKGGASFQVWELTKEKEGYAARCWSDTPGKSSRLAGQKIPYTDFPEELMPFKLWVEGGVILLPEEH